MLWLENRPPDIMRKYLLVILVMIGLVLGIYVVGVERGVCPLKKAVTGRESKGYKKNISEGFELLRIRKDKQAWKIFEQILTGQPDNLDALWGEAEVLRRARKFKESESILKRILEKEPEHASALISLAYIRYKHDELTEALRLVQQVLRMESLDKQNMALAYMMLGSINSRRSEKGWLLSKIRYGTRIQGYFLRAERLAPDLPEVHLGLGTFCLLAPTIAGGNMDKALKELELAEKIAPDFATPKARLAQYWKKKGDMEKYNDYLQRVEAMDPENSVLEELRLNK